MDRHHETVAQLLIWIEEHIRHSIKITDVVKKSGYSKWYLQKLFRKITNENLASYIRNRKLELAARDLHETDYSIGYICYSYGFESQQAFSRVFSRRFRQPPLKYRQSKRNVSTAHSVSFVIPG